MSRTHKVTDLLDQAETPLQTHILLAQLKMLRDLDRKRSGNERNLAPYTNERGQALLVGLVMAVVAVVLWLAMAALAGAVLQAKLFGV